MRASFRILVADREPAMRQILGSVFGEFCRVSLVSTSDEVLAALGQRQVDILLLDDGLTGSIVGSKLIAEILRVEPAMPIVLLVAKEPSAADSESTPQGIQKVVSKPTLRSEAGRMSLLLLVERTVSSKRHDREEAFRRSHSQRTAHIARNFFIGSSPATSELRDEIERASHSFLNVLLTGETGVGKGLVAECIHRGSEGGEDRPFVAVDLPALPPSLFESELFGHTRGAFTGATATQIGAFEAALDGTLFLDEIGDLQTPLQVKLLRAAESKVIRRLGDHRELHLNVRIIAATNKNLEEAVAAGKFRADLYQRLNELRVHIPPLRERSDDVLPLFEHFVGESRLDNTIPCEISPGAAKSLTSYGWPGNVRELRTLVRRLVDRGLPSVITESTLVPLLPARLNRGPDTDLLPDERIHDFSRRVYLDLLAKHHFVIRDAARALAMPYPTLRSRLKSLDLLEVVREKRGADKSERLD